MILCFKGLQAQKNALYGIWIGTYQVSNGMKVPLKMLLDFEEDSLTIKSFGFSKYEGEKIDITDRYLLEGQKIVFDTQEFIIEKCKKDKLVLHLEVENHKSKLFFTRIIESHKLSTTLAHKSFRKGNEKYTDSIDFVNDSTLLGIGTTANVFHKTEWKIEEYKNLSFLVIYGFHLPYLVTYDKGNVIGLRCYFKKSIDLQLTQLQNSKDPARLYGKWKGQFPDCYELPVPYSNISDEVNNIIEAVIKTDSITIYKHGYVMNFEMNRSSNGDILFWEWKNIGMEYWRILSLCENEMMVEITDKGINKCYQVSFTRVNN